jgi:leader peptidase (prepilin peptidase) / N-methyltransferase
MNFLFASFESLTNLPPWAGFTFFGVLGLVVGSFLNVVIHRVPREESIVFPNSACPGCGKAIKPYDNIPVLSWLILRGKCRNCKTAIAFRYPAVELLTGVLYVFVFWQMPFNLMLPVWLVFATSIVALVFIDAEHMILPNAITYPLLVFGLVVRVLCPLIDGSSCFSDTLSYPLTYLHGAPEWIISLAGAVLGGLIGGGSLWAVGEIWKRLRGVDAMGLGDVKMLFAVGAMLGWRLTLLTIFVGACTGAVAGIFVIARQKDRNLQTQIPFGIFLGIGSLVSFMFGERMIAWYMQKFVP